ncbi:MAG: SGNH/GDSL hydrolase family protein [Pirellulaceae bacterium]|nr:SGNH/GDSL hydrolase family protein [Pirellulaceae bacterium]
MQDHSVKSQSSGLGSFTASERTARFLLLLLELVLISAVVYLFNIEGRRHFFQVLCVIVGGFAIHTWLPMRYRLPFFALLSIACVLFVLGVANGLWVLGIGGLLIGICYLPIGFGMRLALLIAAGSALVTARFHMPLPFWPVLGSMFMFRLIIYVHDCRREKVMPSLASSISYFFLLPNACFPLFPVVDYKTFRKTWYDEDEWEIYQRGVTWIVRGMVHLLLYRYIKSNLVPSPYELVDIPHITVFMVTNYALYLQVSGQFHLITGLLHLFGFNLPRTHHLFFLASSFSDIWRRINIYWKDFMAKFFFFPMFFGLRSRGATLGFALVSGVYCVFVCTWLLHSWQTFWILGRFPLTVNDMFLWLGVGTCVALNALVDAHRTTQRKRSLWFAALSLSVRTVGMFGLVSLFWSCWTQPGFLVSISGVLAKPEAGRGLFVVSMWMLMAIVVGMLLILLLRWQSARGEKLPALDFRASVRLHMAGLGVVVVFALPWSASMFDPEIARTFAEFQADPIEAEVAGNQLLGYYEDLNMAAIQAGPLISSFSPQDETRRAQAHGFYKISRPADMYQEVELIPGIATELDGSPFTVNQFGMRDRTSLTLLKPAGTFRIALVGSSIVMGYGVSDDEVFGRVFENRLNSERIDRTHRFEVLNFGVGKQWAPHRLITIGRKVVGFEPDSLFYFAHQDEFRELASHPAQLIANKLELPSQHLKDIAVTANVTADMAPGAILSRLQPYESDLLSAVYKTIVDECRDHGIVPVWIYLPIPNAGGEKLAEKLIPIATSAGFIVCDLSDWAPNQDGLFPWKEPHPNARGHQLIADALMRMVQSNPSTLPLTQSE